MLSAARGETRIRYAFLLAALSCALGLFFTLMKSPSARSDAYLATSIEYSQKSEPGRALTAAYKAVNLDPASLRAWQVLSRMLQESGQSYKARKAEQMALRLEKSGDNSLPVYAMPADFKLSLLAAEDTDIR